MFPTTLAIELICLLFSLVYLRNRKVGYWHHLVWFMLVITIMDGVGWGIAFFLHKSNHWIYNIELPFEVLFIAWLFGKIFKPLADVRFWIDIAVAVFFVVFILEASGSNFMVYAGQSSTIAAILFVVGGGFYYYFLLNAEEYVSLFSHPPFWLVSGMFMFYFASTATNVFFQELMQLNILHGVSLRYIIFTVLNAILYGCWIYAFRCRYQQVI